MEDGATNELLFTILMMAVLLAFGIAAVVAFILLWRKENKGRGKSFFD